MSSVLLKNADCVLTMDDAGREIAGGGVFVEGNRIAAVGGPDDLPATADEVIDLAGHILLPGLVNTHHHMFQTLTRVAPAGQDAELFGWLRSLFPIWQKLTPEMVDASTELAMAELLQSGCTTTSDHLYIYPNDCRLDDSIEAARRVGMRFHASRGSMSLGQSAGGLPPDSLVEDEDDILRDCRRVIEAFHDPAPLSMLRIALAPCSPYTVSEDLMRETAALARDTGARLHTHIAECAADVAFSRERFDLTPSEYVERLGWVGEDVWHAHCVHIDQPGIDLFARSGTGVAHCPCSNMRLGSGIAPVRAMLDAGVPIGLGVDGSASSDAGNLMSEARQAMLLQRAARGADAMTARRALALATRGGARVLGRDDLGALIPGMAADLAAFDLRRIEYSGARHDPAAALVFCGPTPSRHTMVNGRFLIRDGAFTTLDPGPLIARHGRLSAELMNA
ncbi:8-oxoguanine deaminase [Roseovarius spongiae]|uniref:8-oxoguanine deaminase n=1 Tax=Roseovarius spongiae TaxID=2320272 RepID=A0A3A8B4N6_9RHOB|nr:8-oxoguanine deaminase [Roseovarius spongiae]RKF16741.1 8-oxoguanine deaminase [Roseovarius spongiae]